MILLGAASVANAAIRKYPTMRRHKRCVAKIGKARPPIVGRSSFRGVLTGLHNSSLRPKYAPFDKVLQ